jgi:TonB-linked SusC/RagA family outer membrane protein
MNMTNKLIDGTKRAKLEKRMKIMMLSGLFLVAGTVMVNARGGDSQKTLEPQQDRVSITGTVVDQTGEPVIGANVMEKGTSNGTVTDMDGNFSLSVAANATLQVSYIGFVTQDVGISSVGGKPLIITLLEDTQALDEVVVIGYGVQKKSNVTGAISSLKADDLKNIPVSNAASALQGKVSGVQVVNSSGAPGATPSIRVRGYSSNGLSDPLYIVDGLKVSDISFLEPTSIESMEVLKDAASAAIYGAEAGNGVILITTKTGVKGLTKVLFDAQWIYSSLAKKVKVLNADQYTQYYTEALGTGFTSLYDQYNIAGVNTDWQNEMYETGAIQKYNLGVQGGNDSGNFFLTLGYMNNDGMMRMDRDYYRRITGQINASYNIKPWLEVGSSNTITSVSSSTVADNQNQYGILKDIVNADPLMPVFYNSDNLPEKIKESIAAGLHPIKDDGGNYYGYSWLEGNSNPLAAVQINNETNRSFYINGMTYANIKPFKNFVFTTRLGYTLGNLAYDLYNPTRLNSFQNNLTETTMDLRSQQTTIQRYQWENFINYTLETEKVGNFSGMAGMSYINGESAYVSTRTNALTQEVPNFIYMDYSSSSATDFVLGNRTNSRQIAYFGRLSWDYLNRYNFQANFRADSYDAAYLDLEHNWGYFPSLSAGWTFSNESFMENVAGSVFSYGKLRASYGINGSISNLGSYAYIATLGTGQYDPANQTANMTYWLDGKLYDGTYPNSVLANPKLRWERSKQFDAGLDLRFLNNRLSATVDYYHKLTDGLLVASAAPLTTGALVVYQNVGEVTNSGFEVELEWKDRIGEFNYGVKGNIATVNNKVAEYRGAGTRIGGSGMLGGTPLTFFEEGYPIWYIRGYKLEGVNETTGEPVFADLVKDGEITDADRTNIGKAIPDLTYGVTLSASYKNFDFNIYGAGASGNQLVYGLMSVDPQSHYNRPEFLYESRWTGSNTQASLPGAVYQINDSRFYQSDAFVFDASFFKIKQIQLGYTAPKKWLKPVVESVRAYVSLENFFTFTKYPGSDPETNASSTIESGSVTTVPSAMALDYGGYPIAKSVSFGFNITF